MCSRRQSMRSHWRKCVPAASRVIKNCIMLTNIKLLLHVMNYIGEFKVFLSRWSIQWFERLDFSCLPSNVSFLKTFGWIGCIPNVFGFLLPQRFVDWQMVTFPKFWNIFDSKLKNQPVRFVKIVFLITIWSDCAHPTVIQLMADWCF